MDAKTYRLLIPAPWGDSGYSKWGMRATEARILRSVLMWRAHNDPQSALFDYGDRRWFLNVPTYKSASAALSKRNLSQRKNGCAMQTHGMSERDNGQTSKQQRSNNGCSRSIRNINAGTPMQYANNRNRHFSADTHDKNNVRN